MVNRFGRIEQTAREQVENGAFSGIEWLVLHQGGVFSRGQTGMADALENIAMPESPIYRIYSMTKPIVSVVALMLIEQGRLRLYDPLAAWLPGFRQMSVVNDNGETRPASGPIMIEHLLTHRAGLSYGFHEDCPVGQMYRKERIIAPALSLQQVVNKVAAMPLAFDPGQRWHYSVASDVLARVLEVVCGKNLPDILDEFVMAPLGMDDTSFVVPESKRHRIMGTFGKEDLDVPTAYDGTPQKLISADLEKQHPSNDPQFWRGGHGLFSTVDDYAKFLPVLATGTGADGQQLLSRKMVELMLANRIPENQLPLRIGPILLPGYGFSLVGRVMLNLGEALGLTSEGEHGWAGAASTYFWIDPKEDLMGLVMAQYLGPSVPIGDYIRNAVYQALE